MDGNDWDVSSSNDVVFEARERTWKECLETR